jgi:hypothetical protein
VLVYRLNVRWIELKRRVLDVHRCVVEHADGLRRRSPHQPCSCVCFSVQQGLFEVPKYACSWRGAVSVGCGVLDVHVHRTASTSMLMCHQADSGSIICADASRCERRLICVSAACSLSLARSGPPSVARQAQRPSETQLAWSRISRKRRNEIHT